MIKVHSKSQLPIEIEEREFILIDTNGNEKEARKIVDSLKGKKVSVGIYGYDDSFNRRVIETLKTNYLFNPERILQDKKDTLKQRDSGINQVVAKEMARKKISLVIDLEDFSKISKKEKAVILSRIIQNIKICRKAKCIIKFFSMSIGEKDLKDLSFSLGMSSQQVKESILKI